MLQMILEFMREMNEADKKGKWIGNERYFEMQAQFDEELQRVIDARIKAINNQK